jgi:DNA-binding MarR family transcriptional regulator
VSEQLALRLARRSDHDSSRRAAVAAVASGTVAGHEAKILAALREAGCALTLHQLAAATRLEVVQVARRLAALVKRGEVHRLAVPQERLRWMLRKLDPPR